MLSQTLQHFHSITTPKNRCAMQKNRCHRLRERFSGRCAPRRCLSLSQRFFFQRQRLVDNRCLRVTNRTVFKVPNNNGFYPFSVKTVVIG
jgi:hypothetical protein